MFCKKRAVIFERNYHQFFHCKSFVYYGYLFLSYLCKIQINRVLAQRERALASQQQQLSIACHRQSLHCGILGVVGWLKLSTKSKYCIYQISPCWCVLMTCVELTEQISTEQQNTCGCKQAYLRKPRRRHVPLVVGSYKNLHFRVFVLSRSSAHVVRSVLFNPSFWHSLRMLFSCAISVSTVFLL